MTEPQPQYGRISSMCDMFQNMAKVQFQPLHRGRAESLSGFYDAFVLQNELDSNVVLGWWRLLKRYCSPDNDQLIAFVRRYGNCKPRDRQRRGFLSRYSNGQGYVFCDNSVADYFYAMAKAGFVPAYNDFVNFINSRQFPCAVRCAQEEYVRDNQGNLLFQAYTYQPDSKPTGLYLQYSSPDGKRRENKQWYMAHILDVDNPNDYCPECLYGEKAGEIFSQGNRNDWRRQNGSEYPYRDMGRDLEGADREIIVAHFLRLVNPMNYFLTPQTHGRKINNRRMKIQSLLVDRVEFRRGIQELPAMKRFVRMKRIEKYGEAFLEYEKLAKSLPRGYIEDDDIDKAIDLHFCPPNEKLDGADIQVEALHIRGGQRRNANENRALEIAFDPEDQDEFKRTLLQRSRAKRIFVYADGSRVVDIWCAKHFTQRSDLMKNIRSSVAYRTAVRDGATKLELNFDGLVD